MKGEQAYRMAPFHVGAGQIRGISHRADGQRTNLTGS